MGEWLQSPQTFRVSVHSWLVSRRASGRLWISHHWCSDDNGGLRTWGKVKSPNPPSWSRHPLPPIQNVASYFSKDRDRLFPPGEKHHDQPPGVRNLHAIPPRRGRRFVWQWALCQSSTTLVFVPSHSPPSHSSLCKLVLGQGSAVAEKAVRYPRRLRISYY